MSISNYAKYKAAVTTAERDVTATAATVESLALRMTELEAERQRRAGLTEAASSEAATDIAAGAGITAAVKKLFGRGESQGLSDLDTRLFEQTRLKVAQLYHESKEALVAAKAALADAERELRYAEIRSLVIELQNELPPVAAKVLRFRELLGDFTGAVALPVPPPNTDEALIWLATAMRARNRYGKDGRLVTEHDAALITAWQAEN